MMMLSWLFLGICLIDFDDNYGGFVDDKGWWCGNISSLVEWV
jgi:hypothetical protein